ncbi:MAG: helix-hairpin-helix domain-containing protein, partial [Chloroflexota bacterium]
METRININTAPVEELMKLAGIGEVLAERIVEYRTTVGRFRTVGELAAVSGITDQMVADIADSITVGDAGDDEENPPLVIAVHLQNQASHPYTGHRLMVHFTKRESLPAGDDEPPEIVLCNVEVAAELSDDGRATVTLPSRDQLQGEARFRILAPDGETLRILTVPVDNLSSEMIFDVEPRLFFDIEPSDDPAFGAPNKIRGRVIDASGRMRIKDKQVVIWGATADDPDEDDFRALIVAQTDDSGYFSGPYPVGSFTAAFGAIAIGDGFEVTIHLEEDNSFPAMVLLVLDELTPEEIEEDCGCSPAVVPRLPDGEDLVQPDGTFSDDIGARRCVDFTKPNRVLEEFGYSYALRTTEPEIRGLTLEEPDKISVGQILKLFPSDRLTGIFAQVDRPAVEVEAAAARPAAVVDSGPPQLLTQNIDARILKTLAKDPDAFSATSLVTAANLTARDNLVRGINKVLKCAPARTRLDCDSPVDWDDEPTIYQACTIAHGHMLRFKQEWVADGYSMGDLLYSLPLAPAQKKQIAIVEWERTETAARTESLIEREQLAASLSRDRDINEVVSATLTESVRGGSTARTGAFGGGLGIGAILGPVGGLLGIGGGTSKASSSAWQDSSRRTAASSLQQLRDRTAQAASSLRSQRSTVVQTVRQGERLRTETESVANYNHCHAITVQYFEVLRHLLVRQRLVDVQECLFVPLLMSRFNRDKALRWRDALRNAVISRRLRRGFGAMERIENNYEGSDLPTGAYADETLEHLDGYLHLRFKLARPRDNEDGFNEFAWNWSGLLLPWIDPEEFHSRHLEGQEAQDEAFIKELGPTIAENFVQLLRFYAVDSNDAETELPIDPTLASDFRNNRRLYVSLRLDGALPALARKDIKYIKISYKAPDDKNLSEYLPLNSKVIVESGRMSYRTEFASGHLFRDSRIVNDLTGADDVRIYTPLSRQEQRKPREEDKELSRQLLDHLNENLERYHHAIWWQMSDDRRYMLLDGFEAPNSGGRSVASVVENELIGIAGNSLIMPVARGFHLDPTYNQDVENPVDLLEHYQPNTPIEPIRIALPTKGVYAEAVMGACNSCEVMEEDRFWRWEQSPIPDSPTAILPVSTDTRRAEPPSLEAKDFPAPIVAMQQAPAAPDPTGLSAALQLLGQADLFRDITGLTENQKNALASLQAALNTAGQFGQAAGGLATTGAQIQARERMFKAVRNALEDELIDSGQASELFEKIILGTDKAKGKEPAKTEKKKESAEKKLEAIKKALEDGQIDTSDQKDLSKRTLRQLIDDGQAPMSGANLEGLAEAAGDAGVNLSQLKPSGEMIEAKSFPDVMPGSSNPGGLQLVSGGDVSPSPAIAKPLAAAERKFQQRTSALRTGAV